MFANTKIVYVSCLVMALLFVGCGQKLEDQEISKELVYFVENFKEKTGINFTNTDVFLADIPDKKDNNEENKKYPVINGECIQGVGTNVILININYFYNWTDRKKEYILLHELGHCLVGLPHTEKLREDKCPVSIMHPHGLPTGCWDQYQDEYYKELTDIYNKKGCF